LTVVEAQEVLRRRLEDLGPTASVSASEVARVLGITEQEVAGLAGSVRSDLRRKESARKRRKMRDIFLASIAGVFALVGVFFAGALFMPLGAFQSNVDHTVQRTIETRDAALVAGETKGLTFTSNGSEVAKTEAIFDLKDAPGFKLLIDQSLRNLDKAFPNRFEQSNSVYSSQDELKFLERNAARGQFAFVQINLTAVGSDERKVTSELIWPVYSGSRPQTLAAVEHERSERLKEALGEVARKAMLLDGSTQGHPSVAKFGG
jgi:hypothetical protein